MLITKLTKIEIKTGELPLLRRVVAVARVSTNSRWPAHPLPQVTGVIRIKRSIITKNKQKIVMEITNKLKN